MGKSLRDRRPRDAQYCAVLARLLGSVAEREELDAVVLHEHDGPNSSVNKHISFISDSIR